MTLLFPLAIAICYLYWKPVFESDSVKALDIVIFVVSAVVLALISFFSAYEFFKLRPFKRLKLKDVEVELSSKEPDSGKNSGLIESFTNEIVYFFSETNTDLVIFEDLDRLSNKATQILAKLRELNVTLNNSPLIRSKKIVFLFCLSDTVLSYEEERSKFFDAILPVVPVVTPNNSLDAWMEASECLPEYPVEKRVLKTMSLFVADKRSINNIFSFYSILLPKFSDGLPAQDEARKDFNGKFLVFCTFKELFPVEFEKLLRNKGVLKELLDRNGALRTGAASFYEKEIGELKLRLEKAEKEILNDFDDLKALFFSDMLSKNQISDIYSYPPNNGKNFDSLKTFRGFNPEGYYCSRKYAYHFSEGAKASLISRNGETYESRENAIKDKNSLKEIKGRIRDLELKRSQSYDISLRKLLLEDDLSEHINISDIILEVYRDASDINEKLMPADDFANFVKACVFNGFMDSDYRIYISPFANREMSENDLELLKKAAGQEEIDFCTKIDNPKQFFETIDDDFRLPCYVFNKSFFDQIDSFLSPNTVVSERFINYANNNICCFARAVSSYSKEVDDDLLTSFLKRVFFKIPKIFEAIVDYTDLTEKKPFVVLKLAICAEQTSTDYADLNKAVADSISKKVNISQLPLEEGQSDALISIFDRAKSTFEIFPIIDRDQGKFSWWVLSDNRYAPTRLNFERIITNSDIEKPSCPNLDYSIRSGKREVDKYLANYFAAHHEVYIDEILLKDEYFEIPEVNMKQIVNTDHLSEKNIQILLQKWRGLFSTVESIPPNVAYLAMTTGKVRITMANLEFASTSQNKREIISKWLECEGCYDGIFDESMSILLIGAGNGLSFLSEKAFVLWAKHIKDYSIDLSSIKDVIGSGHNNDDRLSRLVFLNKISFNTDAFNLLLPYPKTLTSYIKNYARELEDTNTFRSFFKPILKDESDPSYFINGYSEAIIKILTSEDVPAMIKTTIFKLSVDHIEATASSARILLDVSQKLNLLLSEDCFVRFLKALGDDRKAISLFVDYIGEIDKLSTNAFLTICKCLPVDYQALCANLKHTFPATSENRLIAKRLSELGLIKVVEEDENDLTMTVS